MTGDSKRRSASAGKDEEKHLKNMDTIKSKRRRIQTIRTGSRDADDQRYMTALQVRYRTETKPDSQTKSQAETGPSHRKEQQTKKKAKTRARAKMRRRQRARAQGQTQRKEARKQTNGKKHQTDTPASTTKLGQPGRVNRHVQLYTRTPPNQTHNGKKRTSAKSRKEKKTKGGIVPQSQQEAQKRPAAREKQKAGTAWEKNERRARVASRGF